MEKLVKKEFQVRGIRMPGLKAKLIKTNGNVAMYFRYDGYYETGLIKRNKNDHVWPNGSISKAGEQNYWNNEDFGVIAKTTRSRKVAEEHYEYFCNRIDNKS